MLIFIWHSPGRAAPEEGGAEPVLFAPQSLRFPALCLLLGPAEPALGSPDARCHPWGALCGLGFSAGWGLCGEGK